MLLLLTAKRLPLSITVTSTVILVTSMLPLVSISVTSIVNVTLVTSTLPLVSILATSTVFLGG